MDLKVRDKGKDMGMRGGEEGGKREREGTEGMREGSERKKRGKGRGRQISPTVISESRRLYDTLDTLPA